MYLTPLFCLLGRYFYASRDGYCHKSWKETEWQSCTSICIGNPNNSKGVVYFQKFCTVVLVWKMLISHGIEDKAKRPSAIQKKYPQIRNNHFLSLIFLSTLSIWGEIRNNYQQALIYLLLCFRQTVLALHRFDPNNIVDYQRVTSHLTLRIWCD